MSFDEKFCPPLHKSDSLCKGDFACIHRDFTCVYKNTERKPGTGTTQGGSSRVPAATAITEDGNIETVGHLIKDFKFLLLFDRKCDINLN